MGRQVSPEQAAAVAMVADAKARGLALTGPDGLLKLFTTTALETALQEEMVEYLGHEKNHADPDRESTNIRNGSRTKTVVSEVAGDVEIMVPRDREGTFEPQIVKKRRELLINHAGNTVGDTVPTPTVVHHGQADSVHQARAQVLDAAYAAHPERFIRRAPTPPELPTPAWIKRPDEQETGQPTN
ncbi:transposase [Frankia sp. R82]|uniref:transposase n=1 Tax=Frankia sp. R82 TaxID=2950553 RepID=UPI0020434500|nr:transposase [Frankia sp. R82]MCM3886510.1 transposase [Frankia sp. R82]